MSLAGSAGDVFWVEGSIFGPSFFFRLSSRPSGFFFWGGGSGRTQRTSFGPPAAAHEFGVPPKLPAARVDPLLDISHDAPAGLLRLVLLIQGAHSSHFYR